MFQSVRDLWQPEDAPPNVFVRNYDLTDALNPFLDNTANSINPASIESTKKHIQKGDLVVSRLRSYLREIAIHKSVANDTVHRNVFPAKFLKSFG